LDNERILQKQLRSSWCSDYILLLSKGIASCLS
jgi:hypothetical protein